MGKPLGIIELLTRVGEDKVRVQNVVESATDFTMRKRPRACAITFLTDALTPGDALHGTGPVGLVIWLPRADVERAHAEHATTPTEPA